MQISIEAKPATILVVDDNETNRFLARSTLEDEGHRVVLATGGVEGVAAFEREQPDCILLDVCMPDIDGFTARARIRALPRGKDIPILFLTALRDVETFDGALLAGGDHFLTKPVRPTELVVRVSAALKLRRMSAELREHYALLKGTARRPGAPSVAKGAVDDVRRARPQKPAQFDGPPRADAAARSQPGGWRSQVGDEHLHRGAGARAHDPKPP